MYVTQYTCIYPLVSLKSHYSTLYMYSIYIVHVYLFSLSLHTSPAGNGVLVTTYAGVRVYRDHLLPQKWDYVILDEGHKIRNPDTEITLTCKQV